RRLQPRAGTARVVRTWRRRDHGPHHHLHRRQAAGPAAGCFQDRPAGPTAPTTTFTAAKRLAKRLVASRSDWRTPSPTGWGGFHDVLAVGAHQPNSHVRDVWDVPDAFFSRHASEIDR